MKLNRRNFLKGCGLAIGAGAVTGMPGLVFGNANDSNRILIVLFLRGGCDWLNFIPPLAGADRLEYETARPNLQIPVAGMLPLDARFGLHPAAAALKPLYDQGLLAIVRAVGNLNMPSRSHFEAMAMLEDASDGNLVGAGWLARYFASLDNLPPTIQVPSLAASNYTPRSLVGDPNVLTMDNPGDFDPADMAHWGWDQRLRTMQQNLFGGTDRASLAGSQALTAVEIIGQHDFSGYVPANGALYPNNGIGRLASMTAQVIKLNVGLRVATLDMGGWDTHSGQAGGDPVTGFFADNLVTPLSQTLATLMSDLDDAAPGGGSWRDRVTLVVQTEFGRRVRENADLGTDHGYGADMLILGGGVNGGQVYGDWPGLANAELFEGEDVLATTDYRRVLSEILIRRLENPYLGQIFPGYSGYSPMGVVQGADLPPNYDPVANEIFADGFED